MTHQSGIPVSQELLDVFAQAKDQDNTRFILANIKDEQVKPVSKHPKNGNDESDWGSMISLLTPNTPLYVLFQLDQASANSKGNQWVLLCYVPDESLVKERMLYASTRDTVKRQLGYNCFSADLFGASPEEIDWAAYKGHQTKEHVDSSLTLNEKLKGSLVTLEVDPGHTREYVHSVKFPLSAEGRNALQALLNGSPNNLVQLSVDTTRETIELRGASPSTIESLSSKLPVDDGCFSFIRYDHEFEGSQHSPVIFIYSNIGTSPIKTRMLYSTVKAVVVGTAEELGIKVEKKLEVSEQDEVNKDVIYNELHPPKAENSAKINRPSKPGRGPSRLTSRKK